MSMFKLIEYSEKYVKRTGSLSQYYRDEPASNMVNTKTFNFKSVFIHKTDNTVIVNVKIVITLTQRVVSVIFGKSL